MGFSGIGSRYWLGVEQAPLPKAGASSSSPRWLRHFPSVPLHPHHPSLHSRHVRRAHKLEPRRAYSVAEARRRLEKLLVSLPDWRPIEALAPTPAEGPTAPPPSSYVASLLGASLELATVTGSVGSGLIATLTIAV